MVKQMHCMVCNDVKKAEVAAGEAKCVLVKLRRVLECIQHRGYNIETMEMSSRHPFFGDDGLCRSSVRAMCGVCVEIDRYRKEVEEKEEIITSLTKTLYLFLHGIKTTDKEFFSQVRAELFRALAGRYPKAVRLILDS